MTFAKPLLAVAALSLATVPVAIAQEAAAPSVQLREAGQPAAGEEGPGGLREVERERRGGRDGITLDAIREAMSQAATMGIVNVEEVKTGGRHIEVEGHDGGEWEITLRFDAEGEELLNERRSRDRDDDADERFTIAEGEAVLDWLEAGGYVTLRELSFDDDGVFEVETVDADGRRREIELTADLPEPN